ncbi:MAG: uroporphyrinogen decarboxylase family protein [Verrucomicrobiia bacterium]
MKTRCENLRSVLRGEAPAWVPFCPNFNQWFVHHQKFGTLPPELRGCRDYLDAMKVLGCDIFSRNLPSGFTERDTKWQRKVTVREEALGKEKTMVYETPFGALRQVTQDQNAISSAHVVEYLVKDWGRDGDAFRAFMEQREFDWDEEAFLKTHRRVGDDGILNVAVGSTPLKFLHTYFGLDHSCLFVMDHPEAAKEVCDLYWSRLRPVLLRVASHPEVESAILMDNVDTPFYPPSLAVEYWAPYVKEAVEIMGRHGKPLFVHACGKLKGLARLFAETRVSGLEGISHPPLGDWTAAEAQACHPGFIFIGGFSAREQEMAGDATVREFYREYLGAARKERFIFASSCQTAVQTSWERLKLVREICREWGGEMP